jgi:hypothetical protein
LLTKTVAQCTGTMAPECPVLDILDVQRSKWVLKRATWPIATFRCDGELGRDPGIADTE